MWKILNNQRWAVISKYIQNIWNKKIYILLYTLYLVLLRSLYTRKVYVRKVCVFLHGAQAHNTYSARPRIVSFLYWLSLLNLWTSTPRPSPCSTWAWVKSVSLSLYSLNWPIRACSSSSPQSHPAWSVTCLVTRRISSLGSAYIETKIKESIPLKEAVSKTAKKSA